MADPGSETNSKANLPMSLQMVDDGRAKMTRFNLMVAGESGLGKTTFLHTVLQDFHPDKLNLNTPKRCQMSKTTSIHDLDSFVHVAKHGDFEIHLFDTPGYGDFLDTNKSIKVIKNDLIKRHEKWIKLRNVYTENRYANDERIHLCLYFMSAGRIKQIDLAFIEALSDIVNVAPIFAKVTATYTYIDKDTYIHTWIHK